MCRCRGSYYDVQDVEVQDKQQAAEVQKCRDVQICRGAEVLRCRDAGAVVKMLRC